MSKIISNPSQRPKIVPVCVLRQVDIYYQQAWSYRSEYPDCASTVADLCHLRDVERGLIVVAFLDIMIEEYGFPVADKVLPNLYFHRIGRFGLEYLHI